MNTQQSRSRTEFLASVDLFSALRGMFRPIVGSGAVSLIFEEPDAVPP